MVATSFIFGGDTGATPESLARQRAVAAALAQQINGAPKNVGEGLSALGTAIAYRMAMGKADKTATAVRQKGDTAFGSILDMFKSNDPAGTTGNVDTTSAGLPVSDGSVPATGQTAAQPGNDVYSDFMGAVKEGGVQNPYALAAIAATGKAESGFDPNNVNRKWSDPSQSGDPGTAGGIMSWRGDRLSNMEKYAALAKENPGGISPATQAKYFLQEDPQLVEALNKAGSVEEAMQLMNNAWKFAGYNKPSQEVSRRMEYANSYLPEFQQSQQAGAGQTAQGDVASLDPSAGMAIADPSIIPDNVPIVPEAEPIVQNPDPIMQKNMQGMQPAMSLTDEVAAYQGSGEAQAQQDMARRSVADAFAGSNTAAQSGVGGEAMVDPSQAQGGQQQVAQALMAVPQGGSASGPTAEANNERLMQLLQAAANPNLSDEQRKVAEILIAKEQRQIQQIEERMNQGADPVRRLQLEKAQIELERMRNPTPKYRQLNAEEKAQLGLDPSKAYQVDSENKVSQIGGGGTTVNVGGEPADGNLRKELDKNTGALWSDYEKQGAVSASNYQDFQLLDELVKVAPQGPISGRLAEMFPGVSSAGDAFQSIVKRIAPTMRAPGSGATSDIEYDGMLKSLAALRNKPEANIMILQIMKSKAALDMERADVISAYGTGNLTAAEARKKIAELNKRSIMTPDMKKALEGLSETETKDNAGAPAVGSEVDGWRFKGDDPADQTTGSR